MIPAAASSDVNRVASFLRRGGLLVGDASVVITVVPVRKIAE